MAIILVYINCIFLVKIIILISKIPVLSFAHLILCVNTTFVSFWKYKYDYFTGLIK